MFKTMAILGFLAGGAAFAVYHHTDWFCCHDGGCALSSGSCCGGSPSDGTVSPCCLSGTLDESCCSVGEAVLIGAVAPKTESCCAAKACCELAGDESCCAGRATAKEAVAGPAALFAKATK